MVPLLHPRPLHALAVLNQRTALDNAREAATALARQRVTRYEIERALSSSAPRLPPAQTRNPPKP